MAPPVKAPRDYALSVVKALALCLVVAGHLLSDLVPHVGVEPALVPRLFMWIYSFHMPLFFICAGMSWWYWMGRGETRSLRTVLVERGRRLLVPYVVVALAFMYPIWTVLGFHAEDGWTGYLLGLVGLVPNRQGHLWFLVQLFLISLLHFGILRLRWSLVWQLVVTALLLLAGPWLGLETARQPILARLFFYPFFLLLAMVWGALAWSNVCRGRRRLPEVCCLVPWPWVPMCSVRDSPGRLMRACWEISCCRRWSSFAFIVW